MLTSLSIKNYALIDQLHVDFSDGLIIITGETGAGKSILLGGLSLILGKRADLSNVKDPSEKCVIEATFNVSSFALKSLFDQLDLDYEDQSIIRREILPSGKSRAFINDTPVNLDSLQLLGKHLLDIHSQHQTLELTNNEFQFQVIDALANNLPVLEEYSEGLKSFKAVKSKLKSLENQKSEALKTLDYNTFLLTELEEANLEAGAFVKLEEEYETLNNIDDIQSHLALSYQLLNADDVGIIPNIREVRNQLSKLVSYSENYSGIYQRLQSSVIEIEDVFGEIEGLQEQLEADPQRLDFVNARIQILHNLMQKHNAADDTELISIREDLSVKITDTEHIDQLILEKEIELKNLEAQLDAKADILHQNREAIIPELVQKLESLLSNLGMPNARFNVSLIQGERFYANGKDDLSFLFAANKGGQFNELKKAASGGELSRIMLAIKAIMSEYVLLPTIMFDEIDTGVSGEISNKMAAIMKQMSERMQVFTITHLPQIAAKGQTHFKVFKEDVNDVTQTQLKQLTEDERVIEIAQMLGGIEVTSSALQHAKELLN